jgi:pimeloyl-ACP methyl ester carboxylesterase
MLKTKYAAVAEAFPVINGVRTRVLEVDGDGPAILLVHGFTDSADTWRPLLSELAALGRRAVAVDLPGHGRADALQKPMLPYLDAFADAFVHMYHGDEPAVLAGNSLGGLVALRAATRSELPLAAVAGLGPAGLAHTRRLHLAETWAKRLDPALRVVEGVPLPRFVVQAFATVFALRVGKADLTVARHYASHFRSARDYTRLRSYLIGGLDEDVMGLPLDLIRTPVLLIWGDRDRLTDINGADRLLDVVSASRLVTFRNGGHVPQVERPAEVARLLADLPGSALDDEVVSLAARRRASALAGDLCGLARFRARRVGPHAVRVSGTS